MKIEIQMCFIESLEEEDLSHKFGRFGVIKFYFYLYFVSFFFKHKRKINTKLKKKNTNIQ